MAGTIKIDYDATLDTAQKLKTVGELLDDAYSRDGSLDKSFRAWEGEAAVKGKETLKRLHKTFGRYKDNDAGITAFLMRAAQSFTSADEKAANEIEASWHEGDNKGKAGTSGSSTKTA